MEDQAVYIPIHSDCAIYLKSDGSFTSRCYQGHHSSQFQVNFQFSYNSVESYWIINQDSSEPVCHSEDISTLMETCIPVNFRQFLCPRKAREIICRKLQVWPLGIGLHQELIERALEDAATAVESMPRSHNVVQVLVHADVVQRRYFADRSALQRWMEEEGAPRMVPTADSVIQALESKEISSSMETDSCCICLDDICGGVVCMPCSHVFHGDCITKWLKTSHYCPLCRFEMPTN